MVGQTDLNFSMLKIEYRAFLFLVTMALKTYIKIPGQKKETLLL